VLRSHRADHQQLQHLSSSIKAVRPGGVGGHAEEHVNKGTLNEALIKKWSWARLNSPNDTGSRHRSNAEAHIKAQSSRVLIPICFGTSLLSLLLRKRHNFTHGQNFPTSTL
jgi:hypothetical protein